jgi:hypothetical protein
MRRQTRNTLLLIVAVVALAGVAWWQVRRENSAAWQPVAQLDANAVQGIAVHCEGCASRRFELARGRWWMREPYDLVANEEAVQRLLAIANAPVRKRLAADALDARKIGLDPPQATLTIEGAAPMQLQFGRTEAINGDRYVRVRGEILLVPDRFSGWLFAPSESELDRHVIPPAAVLREVRVDGETRADLVGAWAQALATRVVAAAHVPAPAGTQRRIELVLADSAEPMRLTLWRSEGGYLLQRESPALVYMLDEAAMQQLLPPL